MPVFIAMKEEKVDLLNNAHCVHKAHEIQAIMLF